MKAIKTKTIWTAGALLAVAGCIAAAGTKSPEILTKELKQSTVEGLAKALKEEYFSEKLGVEAGDLMKGKLAKGEYDSISEGPEFARRLTEDLNSVLKDAHFNVRFSEQPLPTREVNREPNPDEVKRFQEEVRLLNGGFEKVERLPGNIGYLEVRGFMPVEGFRRPADAAMAFLQDTDGLIIDLRRNGGGDPESVQYLCSYLFGSEPVHLNDLIMRREGKQEYWTLKELPGKRLPDKPVYVLTSKRTGSGAEEFAYNLRNLKRATLVGESTWGGANPGDVVRINDHFGAFIPNGQARNPISGTNWEGTGVEPHVKVEAPQALQVAHTALLRALIEKAQGPEHKSRLESALKAVEAKP